MGVPRSQRDPQPDDLLKDNRAPVATDLDDILPGIGPRSFEIGQERFIQRPVRVRPLDDAEDRFPYRDQAFLDRKSVV